MKNIDDAISNLSPERQELIAQRAEQLAQTYTPDVWVVLEFFGTAVPKTYQRVLAGWYGGFVGSDSWKLSSGVTEILDRGKCWEIHNRSGSVYVCYKSCERFSGLTANIFSHMCESNGEDITVKQVKLGVGDE